MYYFAEERMDGRVTRSEGGVSSVFDDPEYRERYREKFLEAQMKGMDMVVYPDGAIVLIENQMVMYTYSWRKRRRDFSRVKFGVVTSAKRELRGKLTAEKGDVASVAGPKEAELV